MKHLQYAMGYQIPGGKMGASSAMWIYDSMGSITTGLLARVEKTTYSASTQD